MQDRPGDGFQAAFSAMLAGDERALDPWLGPDSRGRAALDVYRNTVARARIDALEALYPTVLRLVGPEWFRAAAGEFAAGSPPTSPVLDAYAPEFPDWLETFPPARQLAYLAPVARLDRAWNRAHTAADAPVLSSGRVAALTPARLFSSTVRFHPSVALFWFDWTVPSIWTANRSGDAGLEPAVWDARGEGLLIVRTNDVVTWRGLGRPEWAFLAAGRDGRTLGEAARDAFAADPALNLPEMFAGLLATAAFSTLDPEPVPDDRHPVPA